MTTIHSYTNDQPTLDQMHKDLYRARAAALIDDPDLDRRRQGRRPRAAGTQRQARRHLDPRADPERLGGRFQVRRQDARPRCRRSTTRIKAAADGPLKGVLGYTDQPNVSIDFNHDPHSSVFHLDQTKVMDGNFVRVLSWYDNEWGFSNRMADTAVAMAKLI